MNTCLNCAHWSPKKAGALGREGFGACALLPTHTATAPGHTCPRQRAAAESVTQARAAWLNKIDAKALLRPAGTSKQEMKGRA